MAIDDFPKRLADTRSDNDMSQEDLVRAANVGRSSISRYENGETMPTAEQLLKIAKALNTTCEYLLGEPVPETLNMAGLDEADKKVLYLVAQHLRSKKNK